MDALEQITTIVSDRGSLLDRGDLDQIKMISVDVPLEESEALAMLWEGIALVVNDPLYRGDIEAVD